MQLPETSVCPDALAWGRIQGFETLFWLEVGDERSGIGLTISRALVEAHGGRIWAESAGEGLGSVFNLT